MAILHGLLSRRLVPRPVPPFTLPPLHRLIHHPVRRHEEPAPASRLAARAAKPLHSSPRAPADPTPGPSRVPRPSRRGARASRPMCGKHDARGAAAALLTLRRRRVRNDDILAGDGLAAGLASMFRLRNGLRGSQSRMA